MNIYILTFVGFLSLGCLDHSSEQSQTRVPQSFQSALKPVPTTKQQLNAKKSRSFIEEIEAREMDLIEVVDNKKSDVGRVIVRPFKANVKWMHKRANANSIFKVKIDNRVSIPISKSKGGIFKNLELGKTHKVIVRLNGEIYESFKFSFEKHGTSCMSLEYKANHGPWVMHPMDCGYIVDNKY